ncbi:20S rRNA accumulation protein 4 [Ceratobasidium sp. AG-Ba]|nr:20S rRNA accumulation protein 4 [Ceratobasidium sp. AG-Ba]QRW02917.1 20S rRNA accumulation protein 4 [Ceratobasidium sp. AG-Ba]
MSDESDWSDSEGSVDQQQTSVLLGIPDGEIKDPKDLRDPNVSRLGGKPCFIPGVKRPPAESAMCKVCNKPCEVLLHIWCPFENSPMDRVLYVFGCATAGCQRRPGSVRAFRQLRFNDKYAAKLEKRKQKAKEKEEKERAKLGLGQDPKANPFSMANANIGGTSNVFGGGFGELSTKEDNDELASGGSEDDYDYEEDETEPNAKEADKKASAEVDALATALTNATIAPTSGSDWSATPAYPAMYLNTVYEYISPPKRELEKKAKKEGGGGSGGDMWDLEQYERAKDVDEVFQRFATRVAEEGMQYELGGTPLAFHTDDVYKKLFPTGPITPGTAIAVTNASHAVSSPAAPRPTYDPSIVPSCGHCGGRRVFECQLMPNMINLLKRQPDGIGSDDSEEGRKKLVAAALGGQGGVGMEWGTCMVFACEADCCDGRECWREEEVFVQWER